MKKLLCIIIAAQLMICLLCGCARDEYDAPPETSPEKTTHLPLDASAKNLVISETAASFGGANAVYPKVSDTPAEDTINDKIQKAAADLATENYSDIGSMDYEICYNAGGILSVLLKAHLKDSTSVRYATLNVNSVSGEDIMLDETFDMSDAWVNIVSLYIETIIRLRKLDTFSGVDINENKQFYLTGSALVILCETYEFTYYNMGDMQFFIPYSVISDYCIQGGAVDIITGKG